MGLAPEVQRQLPFEVDHDRHAWRRATEVWRRAGIRDQAAVPSWGHRPWNVALTALVRGAVAGFAAWVGLGLARARLDTTDLPEAWADRLPLIGLVLTVAATSVVVWQLVRLVLGVLDLFPRRVVEGELVRKRADRAGHRLPRPLQWMLWSGTDEHGMRRDRGRRTHHHLAVDDGSDDSIVAYRVDHQTPPGRARGGSRPPEGEPPTGLRVRGGRARAPTDSDDPERGSRPGRRRGRSGRERARRPGRPASGRRAVRAA